MVILTDGAPSGGDRWNIELMGRLLGDEKRLRHVDLQMVLFGSSKGLKRRWIEVLDGLGGSGPEHRLIGRGRSPKGEP